MPRHSVYLLPIALLLFAGDCKKDPVIDPLPEVCLDSPIGIDDTPAAAAPRFVRREYDKVVQIGGPSKYRWPRETKVLRVRFLNGDTKTRLRVLKYANEWTANGSPIRFELDTAMDSEIRIEFARDGYSQTTVGIAAKKVPDHKATMHFGWLTAQTEDEKFRRTVLHEFGHALGLTHEHQSANAPKIPWKADRIYRELHGANSWWTKERVKKNFLERYSRGQGQYSTYDPASIMIYPIPVEWVDDPKYVVGWNTHLSSTDIEWISKNF